MREYAFVAQHGTKRVHHVLPRLLTAVNEFGNDVLRLEEAANNRPGGSAAAMIDRLSKAAQNETPRVRWTLGVDS